MKAQNQEQNELLLLNQVKHLQGAGSKMVIVFTQRGKQLQWKKYINMDLHTTVKGSAFMKDTLKEVKGQGHIATEKTTSLKIILKK